MDIFTVGDLKRDFSALLDRVRKGERVVIAFGTKKEKVAMLVPYDERAPERILGLLTDRAKCRIASDFGLSDQELLDS